MTATMNWPRRGRQGRRADRHLGDMRTLFDDIPLEQMNTSMTINATAPWLLALYIAVAEEQGADVRSCRARCRTT
jgi:methylmalonyl-CoA mutase N-terminal domain/subunit